MGTIESGLIHTEEKEGIKEYLNVLDEADLKEWKTAVLLVCGKIDWLKHNMSMVSCEMEYVREKADDLRESIGKGHAIDSIAAAADIFALAGEHFAKAESLIENGVKTATIKYQNNHESKTLQKLFPLLAVENELKDMMECLNTMFVSIDIGIGRTEEAEGMACDGSHYKDVVRGGLWEGGEGEQALLGVMWPMRTLEKVVRQTRDAAYDIAVWVDSMRPKAHSIIKKPQLEQGYFWKKEKQAKRQEAKKLTARSAKEKPTGTRKLSLRKRLQAAEITSRTAYLTPVYDKEKKVCEVQR